MFPLSDLYIFLSLNIDMSETRHFVSASPAAPLAPHLASSNCVLVGGVYTVQLRTPLRDLLRCHFTLRSESSGCSKRFLPH